MSDLFETMIQGKHNKALKRKDKRNNIWILQVKGVENPARGVMTSVGERVYERSV